MKSYLEKNKFSDCGAAEKFPSIEHNKKMSNEFTPTLINSKILMEKIKQSEKESIIKKNKLVLETLIADRLKRKVDDEEERKIQAKRQEREGQYYI
jgi:hypothetical protein